MFNTFTAPKGEIEWLQNVVPARHLEGVDDRLDSLGIGRRGHEQCIRSVNDDDVGYANQGDQAPTARDDDTGR